MCWLVHKPANVVIPEDLLEVAYKRNDDGFGIMYYDAMLKQVVVAKVLPKNFDDVLALYNEHKHRELGIHFRMRTSGATNLDMVHPFKVLDKDEDGHDVYMMHNGILNNVRTTATHSDTYFLATEHLKPMLRHGVDLLQEKAFRDLMVLQLGRNNKLLLLDDTGKFTRIYQVGNDSVAFDDGFWCSNTYAISGQRDLGYDLERNKSFVKEVKQATRPFEKGNDASVWDEAEWEAEWNRTYGYGPGAGMNDKNWKDPLKPVTPTASQVGNPKVAVNTGTGTSVGSIKVVKPACVISSLLFKTEVDANGTVVHTRKTSIPDPGELKDRAAETRVEIVNGTQVTTYYNAKGEAIGGKAEQVNPTPALTVPSGANDKYVKITPADIAEMDDEEIWDWVVNYPDEAAEYLIELKEGLWN